MKLSPEYIASIASVIVLAMHAFGVEVANNVVATAVAGVAAIITIVAQLAGKKVDLLGRVK